MHNVVRLKSQNDRIYDIYLHFDIEFCVKIHGLGIKGLNVNKPIIGGPFRLSRPTIHLLSSTGVYYTGGLVTQRVRAPTSRADG